MATQNDIALAMIQQLRVLDPAISANVGTPERKIIDTVAQVIADRSVDLNGLEGVFDLDSKFGDDLDKFLGIFGYGRQNGSQATGYVKFSRTTPSPYTIPIGQGTPVSASLDIALVNFITSAYGEIPAGQTEVVIPVRCIQVGAIGNVSANTITQFGRNPITGITNVTNEVPTTGGSDPESDAEFKVRFRNTVFRNLAGTYDQFLALAVSTQFTTKANVVGPISRYQEYIQVPDVDDATNDPDSSVGGNGSGGDYTSALSTIPYSKHVYDTIPYYISNGASATNAIFYQRDLDFVLNLTDAERDKGDTYRGRITSTGPNVNTDPTTDFQPNVTFRNVYTGTDDAVQALRPGDVVLFEHSYMSSESRNDWDRQVLNCVDVFINGENPTLADTTVAKPNGTDNLFISNSTSFLYSENYRRVGEAERRPVQGNVFTGLFFSPVTDLPDTITTSDATYQKGVHYWVIEEINDLGGTVRARTGIEWNPTIRGQAAGDPDGGPFTGPTITNSVDTSVAVTNYSFDRNVVDLQTALEGNKQITTDVLAHRSTTRYFKLDITVMYSPGVSITNTNLAIQDAVSAFFDGQYFGTVIQMSDLLQAIHGVVGVDNVRWSRDLTNTRNNVVECDSLGNPLANALIDRRTYGHPVIGLDTATTEVQQLYITGDATGGTYELRYQSGTPTAPIAYNASASALQSALNAVSIPISSVSGTGTATDPYILTFSSTGARDLIAVYSNSLTSPSTTFNTDFFLKDNELPALPTTALSTDTVAGLIIRPRAQNTWNQL